jgi:hypothetical protein
VWIPEDEAITYVALATAKGDRHRAEVAYLTAASSGGLAVYGRRALSGRGHEELPREDWQRCTHQRLADPLCGVFHFPDHVVWTEREVRRSDLERLWLCALDTGPHSDEQAAYDALKKYEQAVFRVLKKKMIPGFGGIPWGMFRGLVDDEYGPDPPKPHQRTVERIVERLKERFPKSLN